jgi:transposase-like protein
VLSLIDKGTGEVRSRVVPDVTGATLRKAIAEQVDMPNTVLHTDGAYSYKSMRHEVARHEYVDHPHHEYVRGDVSTNQAENFFSQLKRSLDGTHHHVSRVHLHRYLGEFDFRYSTKRVTDTERMRRMIDQAAGRRLSYDESTGPAAVIAVGAPSDSVCRNGVLLSFDDPRTCRAPRDRRDHRRGRRFRPSGVGVGVPDREHQRTRRAAAC